MLRKPDATIRAILNQVADSRRYRFIQLISLLRHELPCAPASLTARTSQEPDGEGGDQLDAQGCDRVGHVALRAERRRLGVDNPWKGQVFGGIGLCGVHRGESLRFG